MKPSEKVIERSKEITDSSVKTSLNAMHDQYSIGEVNLTGQYIHNDQKHSKESPSVHLMIINERTAHGCC